MHDLVILAGGKGSRIKKYLNNGPKPLVKFNNIYFLDYLLFSLSKYNFENIYIMAGYKGHMIKKIYDKQFINLSKIRVIIEKKQLDTAGCLSLLKSKIKNDFFVTNGDTIFDVNLFDLKKNLKKNAFGVVALTKPNNDIVNKKLSSISLKRNNIIETSTNGIYVNGGVYFFKNKFLKLIPLKKISLENDIIPILIKKKKFFGKYYPNFFIDIGSHKYFNLAKKKLFKFFFRPALFLDRDGTINQDKKGYTYKLNELKFMPKIIKKLKNFSRNSYYFFIITNQSGIAKKKFSQKNFLNFQRELYKKLNSKSLYINDTEYCPHHPEAKLLSLKKKCQCRKPNNLMIRRIINKWPINIKKSLFVGDQITDYKVSKKSKIKFQYYKDFIKF